MTNYKITYISYFPLCLIAFVSIILCSEIIGILSAIIERDLSALASWTFFGMFLGIAGAIFASVFIFLFNLFIPITKGISVHIDALDIPSDSINKID